MGNPLYVIEHQLGRTDLGDTSAYPDVSRLKTGGIDNERRSATSTTAERR